jgi:ribosomal protein L37AE/L43A
MNLKSCPTFGSRRIQKLRRDWESEFEGKPYKVQALEFYECPVCGEHVFDREAMRKIESASPAFSRPRLKRPA